MAMSTPTMPMTTSNSISVNPLRSIRVVRMTHLIEVTYFSRSRNNCGSKQSNVAAVG